MSVELLTFATLGQRIGCSPEAARALAKQLRLVDTGRAKGNDGKANVADNLAALDHGGVDWPADVIAELASDLNHEFSKLETAAAGHRANYQYERDRSDWLTAEVLKAMSELMEAREATARLECEIAAMRARQWWRRLAGWSLPRTG
jgi:hypothetical protein